MAYECHSPQSPVPNISFHPLYIGGPVINMAERIRNNDWENDEEMRQDLEKYLRQNLRREEMLDFMVADYPMYAWSIRSLSRRLQHFGIKYTDYEIDLENVKKAVKKELDGPGVLLGYRAMQQKVRGAWAQCLVQFSLCCDAGSRSRRTEI